MEFRTFLCQSIVDLAKVLIVFLREEVVGLFEVKLDVIGILVVDEALQYDPQRLDSLLYKAQALLEGQIDARQGRRLLERYAERAGPVAITPQTLPSALEARKTDGNAQYFIAELYRAVGYPDQALKALEQALQLGFGPAPQYREAPAQQA